MKVRFEFEARMDDDLYCSCKPPAIVPSRCNVTFTVHVLDKYDREVSYFVYKGTGHGYDACSLAAHSALEDFLCSRDVERSISSSFDWRLLTKDVVLETGKMPEDLVKIIRDIVDAKMNNNEHLPVKAALGEAT
jgi:hypothetical protein